MVCGGPGLPLTVGKFMENGNVCYLAAWLFGHGFYVFEAKLVERRGLWSTVQVRARWRVEKSIALREPFDLPMTVRSVHLRAVPEALLAIMQDVQIAIQNPAWAPELEPFPSEEELRSLRGMPIWSWRRG
jgi:hypothetical protein